MIKTKRPTALSSEKPNRLMFQLVVVVLAALFSGCTDSGREPAQLEIGRTRAQVREILGDPDRVHEFEMPGGPFFGPQEALTGLVEAGQPVLEWVYEQGDRDIYLWFTGDSGSEPELWKLIHTAEYPADAVY